MKISLKTLNSEMKQKLDEITEEDITLSKERRICLVHKGPSEGIIYVCPECSAVYCFNCYEAIREIENACWSCNHPMDPSKPPKRAPKEQEIDIIPEIENRPAKGPSDTAQEIKNRKRNKEER